MLLSHFLHEKVRNSNEKHLGQKGILWCSFVPKRSKIGQEMSELRPFSPSEVAWFNWGPQGKKEKPLAFICIRKIQNLSRNGWVMAIFSLRGCLIPLRTTWDKRESFGSHPYQRKRERTDHGWSRLGNHGCILSIWKIYKGFLSYSSLSEEWAIKTCTWGRGTFARGTQGVWEVRALEISRMALDLTWKIYKDFLSYSSLSEEWTLESWSRAGNVLFGIFLCKSGRARNSNTSKHTALYRT